MKLLIRRAMYAGCREDILNYMLASCHRPETFIMD